MILVNARWAGERWRRARSVAFKAKPVITTSPQGNTDKRNLYLTHKGTHTLKEKQGPALYHGRNKTDSSTLKVSVRPEGCTNLKWPLRVSN